jgi:hypothetical protein
VPVCRAVPPIVALMSMVAVMSVAALMRFDLSGTASVLADALLVNRTAWDV